jgi:hypothetical protein
MRCSPMKWTWRGSYFPTSRNEYEMIKGQVEYDGQQEGKSESLNHSLAGCLITNPSMRVVWSRVC